MEDFQDQLTIKITGKTHYAMIAFLKKHGADSHDLSAFVEDAIRWRILDREIAFLHAKEGEIVELFPHPAYEEERAG